MRKTRKPHASRGSKIEAKALIPFKAGDKMTGLDSKTIIHAIGEETGKLKKDGSKAKYQSHVVALPKQSDLTAIGLSTEDARAEIERIGVANTPKIMGRVTAKMSTGRFMVSRYAERLDGAAGEIPGRIAEETFMNRQLITAGGKTIEFPEKDFWLQRHLNHPGSYADTILDQINRRQLYRPLFAGMKDILFVDVGANVGLVSLHAQDVCRQVVAVEPSDHFDLLGHVCRPYPNIFPLKYALSDRDGPVTLWMCEGNSTMNSTMASVGGRSLTVEGFTLTSLLNIPPMAGRVVDIVKLDIEGAEMAALNDAALAAGRESVRYFYVEVHPLYGATMEQNVSTLERKFQAHGFSTTRLPENAILAANASL